MRALVGVFAGRLFSSSAMRSAQSQRGGVRKSRIGQAAPTDQLTWEISRFAVDRFSVGAGVKLYGLLVEFARLRAARSLIAVVDLQHERRLRQVGIVTRRFGPETVIGVDRFGRPIEAVFGEIPLPAQSTKTLFKLSHMLDNLEIQDETLVFGHTALSA